MSTILGAFNSHLIEFLEDIESIFPHDMDIKYGKTALELLKKANPRAIILAWKEHITAKYKTNIYQGNCCYFIEKDYTSDIGTDKKNTILEAIDRIRKSIRNMGKENQNKSMKYIQNLTKISELYN